jgi:phosphatidylglycerol:prolipoprotein diacylglycerol transferase
MISSLPLAYALDWGWFRIGPPYIYLNINPVIFNIGPLAVRWYGLMYVVAILVGLQVIKTYTARRGVSPDTLYRTLWWCIAAGLLGGRLYFVIQQHDLVDGYLKQPWRILATWEGGMAFYGAIFLVIATLIWRARKERLNPLVLIDAGVLFAAAGQIFGRIGNIINGDIIGYVSPQTPWATVYQHPDSWACPHIYPPAATCNAPVQPAAGYEMIANLILLPVMLLLARRVRRPGILMLVYLYCYSISQFLLFFTRSNTIETFFGLDWGLKQAQWTSLVVFILLFPLTYWVIRHSKPVPEGELAATYGIPQIEKNSDEELTENKEAVEPESSEVVNGEEGSEETSRSVDGTTAIGESEEINEAEAEKPEIGGEGIGSEDEELASASEADGEGRKQPASVESLKGKPGQE